MKKSKCLNHVREVIRTNHFSYSSEKTYVGWIYRCNALKYIDTFY
ncbi:hypothetical protein ES705_29917 [subsurface metagenome]